MGDIRLTAERFSAFLRFLLDETGLFNRQQWGAFLTVEQDTLGSWAQGQTQPDPTKLRSILRVLRESGGVTGVQERLLEIEGLPVDIPLVLQYGCPTLVEYLCIPLMAGLRRAMAGLTLIQREQIIRDAAAAAHKLKEG